MNDVKVALYFKKQKQRALSAKLRLEIDAESEMFLLLPRDSEIPVFKTDSMNELDLFLSGYRKGYLSARYHNRTENLDDENGQD